MPTYAFRCTACGHEFEVTQSVSAPAVEKCVSCGGAVKKIFFPVGIQFKGAGFHINDYKKSGSNSSESKSESNADKSEPVKSEPVATEAKTETS